MDESELKAIESNPTRDAMRVVPALVAEVRRLRGLIKNAEREGSGPSGYECCPWCEMQTVAHVEHDADCPAFTPAGDVR